MKMAKIHMKPPKLALGYICYLKDGAKYENASLDI